MSDDDGSAPEPRGAEDAGPGSGPALSLVGIGASAGGIAALRGFFEEIPADSGLTYVVVMHLSPEHESKLAEVLQPHIRIPVRQVRERTRMERDHVYVIPPAHSISVTDGHLEIAAFEERRGRRAPIDIFFRTVADVHPDGVGILLSGSGTDGVMGLKAIKQMGGVIMAQSPDEAEYDTMPRAAAATGMVDFVLPARELGSKVVELKTNGVPWTAPDRVELLAREEAAVLRSILAQLRARTGHDFSGYKKSTVLRRVARRMHMTRTADLSGYLDVLRGSDTEWHALLKDLLISVTNFFRDPEAFDALEREVIPTLFEGRSGSDTVRAWIAGCATGEEAYSVAMLLHEHAAGLADPPVIQVFATDLDTEAIAQAREGRYPQAIRADVSEERLKRFFVKDGAYYRITKAIRQLVLFSPHDLLRDPPFSRLDLITSRNLLIYLERALQQRVFQLFRYALGEGGYLFLGGSESMDDGTGFRTTDKRHRIYQRTAGPGGEAAHLPELPLSLDRKRYDLPLPDLPSRRRSAADAEAHQDALERYAPPSILVDRNRVVLHVSPTAARYLEFPAGSPTANLLRVARPELRLELRSVLYHALDRQEPGVSKWITLDIDGEPRRVQIHVAPASNASDPDCALVIFLELAATAGEEQEPEERGEENPRPLREAEAELTATRERLQDVIEQSEGRQEELKAANEELRSINEEYKSTLEELETSKEELQSMNEELKTVNDELKGKVEELAQSNDDLRNLMAATQIATLFLDTELRVTRFTPAAREVFNIRPVDEGRPLEHLTHRLDYPELLRDCRSVVESLKPIERDVLDEEGRSWLARVTPYRTDKDRVGGAVATFTDVSRLRHAQRAVQESEERFRALVEATAEIVWTTDPQGEVVKPSPSWTGFTGQSSEERIGWGWLEAVHPDDRNSVAEAWREAVERQELFSMEFRLRSAQHGDWRVTAARAIPILDGDGSVREWVGMNTDVSERREAEEKLRRAKHAAEQAAEAKSQFLATMSHELRTPLTGVIGITDLLESEAVGELNDQQKRQLGRVRTSAWHLVSIIEEVLTYSKAESGRTEIQRRKIDVSEILQSVVEVLEIQAEEKGIRLEARAPDRLIIVSDGGKIRQIATNLIGNALKFTDQGTVAAELTTTEQEVHLRIRDTGPGIPPHQIDAIFEPFVQGDSSSTREKGGTGLGLTVSRRLARLLGGEIEVEETSPEGSIFLLRLPLEPPRTS